MEWKQIVERHQLRYPGMLPQDYGKLAYQSVFGPAHMIVDEGAAREEILREWQSVPAGTNAHHEDIGGGLCRFHMNDMEEKKLAADVLVKLFILTARQSAGNRDKLEERLNYLEKLPVPGMEEWLTEYRRQNCPPVRHSEPYGEAYAPHYRLVRKEYANWFPVLLEIAKLVAGDEPVVVAIDGRCGSGKTTLAALMEEVFPCRAFHMDDFYLPKPRREENWMTIPGGNMDLERFRDEVLTPALRGEPVCYRPFDCGTGTLGPGEWVEPSKLTVIEGSYSHHPVLGDPYHKTIFLTCPPEEQRRRLMDREGDYYPTFARVWMPLEEQYIRACDVEKRADMICDTQFDY